MNASIYIKATNVLLVHMEIAMHSFWRNNQYFKKNETF